MLYTFAYANGTESLPSPGSATFSVSAGNIPQVTLPPLPSRLDRLQHLPVERQRRPRARPSATPPTSHPRSTNCKVPRPVGGVSRSLNPAATVAPTVLPTGGGLTGGDLAPGTYLRPLHLHLFVRRESFGSPQSLPFTVAAGNVPEVVLPALPNGATGYDIYLSDPSADPGSAVRYASAVTSSNLPAAERRAGWRAESAPVQHRLGRADRQPDRRRDDRRPTAAGHVRPRLYVHLPERRRVVLQPDLGEIRRGRGPDPAGHAPPAPGRGDGLQHLPVRRRGERRFVDALRLRTSRRITYNLQRNALSKDVFPPVAGPAPTVPLSEVLPTVNATGGGTTGGQLAPGTYFVFYSLVSTARRRDVPEHELEHVHGRRPGTSRSSRCRRSPTVSRASTSTCPTRRPTRARGRSTPSG